jgi:hypothetical protein
MDFYVLKAFSSSMIFSWDEDPLFVSHKEALNPRCGRKVVAKNGHSKSFWGTPSCSL